MDRDIAMVFQNYALYPHMSVYDNMAFGLKMRKFDKRRDRTSGCRRRPRSSAFRTISGASRASCPAASASASRSGRAIVRHPQVFLFDEPLSNLDAKLRVQMRVELKKLHERLGTTAIYVTHDQVEAMTLGDRVVVMRDGWVQQVGDPMELYNEPANRFVAGFIGSPAMNFAPVRIASREWRAVGGRRRHPPQGAGADDEPARPLCRQGGDARDPARRICTSPPKPTRPI